MSIFSNIKKVFSGLLQKDIGPSGGLEVLTRLMQPELSTTAMMERYTKSLYVFACISKIAEKVASVDFELFRVINSKGEVKEIQTHPILDLLYQYNPFQTKTEFLQTTVINYKTAGDAFIWKVRNKSGRVVELWNLRPDLMTIVTDPTNFIKQYEFQNGNQKTIFAPNDIIHIKDYPNPTNAYLGMPALKPSAVRVQTEEYATDYQAKFFLNSARPDAIIKNKDFVLNKEQKEDIREYWEKKHRGTGNSSKIAILEGGLEYQQISITQKEMDYIESLKSTRDDILTAFKVPKPIVAITDDVNRANAETAMYIFLSETIKPELVKIVEKLNEELIYDEFGDEYYLDFVDPTPVNRELILKEYESGLANSYLLINEVRQKEGLEPVKGGWSFYKPVMEVPMGGLSQGEKAMQKARSKFEIILPESKEEKKKYINFKGRNILKTKFEILEALEKELSKGKQKQKKAKKKSVGTMIKDTEMKMAYVGLINKQIDKKSGILKDGTDEFAYKQMERVKSNLGKIEVKSKANKKTKAYKKAISVEIKRVFDMEKENKLAIEFISPYLMEFLKSSGEEALQMIAPQENFDITKRIQDLIKKRAEYFAESVNNTTLEKLDGPLSEGIANGETVEQLASRVEDVYTEFPTYRSELIARTESTAANNEGLLEGFKQSDVANAKEWIDGNPGVCPECESVDGDIVGLNETFKNGYSYPPAHPNCRCAIGPAFIEE